MKKIYLSTIILLGFILLTGCEFNIDISNNENLKDSTIKTKGNCTAVECIKEINPENTVEEINDIIGVEGELTDEKYQIYYWELSDDSGIEVSYYSGKTGTIEVDIDRNILVNKKVDLSKYDTLQTKVKSGISYNKFISYIGNVEGTLIEKSSTTNKYIWVAEDGSYLTGSFSNSSGNCTFVTGMVK